MAKNWIGTNEIKANVTATKAETVNKDIVPYPGKPLKIGSKGKRCRANSKSAESSIKWCN
ncbi:hypothetical protein [Gottfriedia luciferensis]|uniref:hypothetical protein n=1 Tax=Gottfriedia luciferensis TaxID=178774 RepID=UPI000B433F36|nr:hypothetical protein [Gottfriedia luciferensis]